MVIPPIQSFYQKEPPASSAFSQTSTLQGSPEANLAGTNREPLTATWKPQGTYQRVNISQLQPGRGKVRFMGRIVNICPAKPDHQPRALSSLTSGFHFMVVKDDTGVVAVKLLGTQSDVPNLHLGKLVTVWTGFVAEYSTAAVIQVPFVSMIIPIHPGPVSQSCIKFHQDEKNSKKMGLCRIPLEYDTSSASSQIPGLMSLKAFLKGTHANEKRKDDTLTRVLVCVSSVGPRKTIKTNNEPGTLELVEVHVCDETNHCVLKLWSGQIISARTWTAGHTILLITNPKFCPRKRVNENPGLGIALNSIVDVDPNFPDAHWLRRMAEAQAKRERIYIPFPIGIWDVEDAINGPSRVLYTLADVDERVREDPKAVFTGKLNVLILGASICESQRQNKLCCFECCNFPLYSNQSSATCKNCHKDCELTINPRAIGPIADETGCVAPGKLVWSDRAWSELLRGGHGVCLDDNHDERQQTDGEIKTESSPSKDVSDPTIKDEKDHGADCAVPQSHQYIWKDLIKVDPVSLKDLEARLLYSRGTLTFGWSAKVKRLCVLGVEW
ncbi:hypothetical protein QBC32DRAFT_270655 [Pseudoneurospora amorphoporcata]|uniref:Uncharacterized protein n=1 Tax=Pseudoneurospora amorphoporcata TaxID=241081 RepID=A0AAN6NME6_9PEZI|nr:hypothetical protein QBC32DRAFT_270655 [Pseudoneurospora amorphoporcata]